MTTVGDIDVELWSKEAPRACRNFIQLCMEGYYDGSIFHRVVKDFIVQGGDPTGTGHGGDSIYGKPFRVRLKLNHIYVSVIHLVIFVVLRGDFMLDFININLNNILISNNYYKVL